MFSRESSTLQSYPGFGVPETVNPSAGISRFPEEFPRIFDLQEQYTPFPAFVNKTLARSEKNNLNYVVFPGKGYKREADASLETVKIVENWDLSYSWMVTPNLSLPCHCEGRKARGNLPAECLKFAQWWVDLTRYVRMICRLWCILRRKVVPGDCHGC